MTSCYVPGLLVNGPYSLITTSVSAELGTHRSLVSSARALATVTAIIDGTGSIGKHPSRRLLRCGHLILIIIPISDLINHVILRGGGWSPAGGLAGG